MLAILKREVKSYFTGMMGYVLTGFMVVVAGIYYLALNLGYGLTDFGYYTLYRTIFVFLIYVPVLTMRCLAEEKKSRTDQLLLTSPVSVGGIVTGKFLSMCVVFALPCAVYAVMILILAALGAGGAAVISGFACLLCYFFVGCAAIAIGEYISSLTENQMIAALFAFAVMLLTYLMPSLQTLFTAGSALALAAFAAVAAGAALAAGLRSKSLTLGCGVFAVCCVALVVLFSVRSAWLTTAFSAVLGALSLFSPFESFINSTFSISALVYYASVTALFLFLSCQSLEKRRWN